MRENTKSLITALFIGFSMIGTGILITGILVVQIPIIIVGVLMIGIGAFSAFMTNIKSNKRPIIV
jgi:hypothetical protein